MKATRKIEGAQATVAIAIDEAKVSQRLARSIEALEKAERKLRRAFSTWDKVSRAVRRYEKQLDRAAAVRMEAEAKRPPKAKRVKVKHLGAVVLKGPDDGGLSKFVPAVD